MATPSEQSQQTLRPRRSAPLRDVAAADYAVAAMADETGRGSSRIEGGRSGGQDEQEEEEYLFPKWWFAFMVSQSIPNSILEGCLWTIIWPQAIADQFGQAEKTKVFGTLASVQVAVQLLSPLVGDMADKMPERWTCSYYCRRRPFIMVGHALYLCGLVCSYFGLYSKNLHLMLGGSLLSGFTQMMQTPNYAALNAETVPPSQRGTMAAIQMQINMVCSVLANVLGILVGEGYLDRHMYGDKTVWWAIMGWKVS